MRIADSATIHGDIVVFAGEVIIDGQVLGNSKITAEKFILNGSFGGNADIYVDTFESPSENAFIAGNLNYKSDKQDVLLESISQ